MRWLFVCLLLLNIGYFAYELNRQASRPTPRSAAVEPLPPGIERLRLVSEMRQPPAIRANAEASPEGLTEEEQAVEPEAAPGETPALAAAEDAPVDAGAADEAAAETGDDGGAQPAAGEAETGTEQAPLLAAADDPLGRCFSVGPFKEEPGDHELIAWFEQRDAAVATRRSKTRERRYFWVYHEPLESAAKARATVQEMVGKGVEDLMMISGGDMANAISLGVFSTQEAVDRRLAELGKQGYQPVVVPQYRELTQFWLDVESPASESITREDLPELSGGLAAVNRDCTEIAKLDTAP